MREEIGLVVGQEFSPADGWQVFIGYLQQACEVAWNPSAAWLSRRSGIPKSTVENLVGGRRKRLPDWNSQVEPLLQAYRHKVEEDGRGDPDAVLGGLTAWKQAYDDAQTHRQPSCPLPSFTTRPAERRDARKENPPCEGRVDERRIGRPIAQLRPLNLEVHPAIDVGAPSLPK
ncbi:hypothetical protein [Streptosporangium subroseum]|uniref:hypothetical protein n=1 Tax=Streptosporangium subroseum TaxID=106412 RepID=UPI0011807BF3|nr:hypothetical protein [Streptosporangium subroseum]